MPLSRGRWGSLEGVRRWHWGLGWAGKMCFANRSCRAGRSGQGRLGQGPVWDEQNGLHNSVRSHDARRGDRPGGRWGVATAAMRARRGCQLGRVVCGC